MTQYRFDPQDPASWHPEYIDVLTYVEPGDVLLLVSPAEGRFTIGLSNSLMPLDDTLPFDEQRVVGVTIMTKTLLDQNAHVDAWMEHLAIPRVIKWDMMRRQFPYWLYPGRDIEERRIIPVLESLSVVRRRVTTRIYR
ncbi:MAG TPA: hypothetical protein VFT59_01770 [Candidatus Saccharimonadales bacterium]|nr:hypothetical protein [Candidatus Saccharimonadales bacterium]